MKIELGGRYVERRTADRLAREGGEPKPEEIAEILRVGVNLANGQSVVALLYGGVETYHADGKYNQGRSVSGLDLVPVPAPRRSVIIHANRFADGSVDPYTSRTAESALVYHERRADRAVAGRWAWRVIASGLAVLLVVGWWK